MSNGLPRQCCEKLGAGEILLNSVDKDGQKDGFDLGLIKVPSTGCCVLAYGRLLFSVFFGRGGGESLYIVIIANMQSSRRNHPKVPASLEIK